MQIETLPPSTTTGVFFVQTGWNTLRTPTVEECYLSPIFFNSIHVKDVWNKLQPRGMTAGRVTLLSLHRIETGMLFLPHASLNEETTGVVEVGLLSTGTTFSEIGYGMHTICFPLVFPIKIQGIIVVQLCFTSSKGFSRFVYVARWWAYGDRRTIHAKAKESRLFKRCFCWLIHLEGNTAV